MMIPVRDAWEEATYTKEALLELNKERGKDLGDDPTADGTGAELGIKDSPPLEGVRGFKLMEEQKGLLGRPNRGSGHGF